MLRNYPTMTQKIHNIEKEIEDARAEAQAVREAGSVSVDGMPRKKVLSDPTYKKAQKIITTYDKRIKYLLTEIDFILSKQQRLTDIMRDLPPDEYAIIKARYLDGTQWDFIPAAVHMSRRTCFNIHDRAIRKMIIRIKK